MPNFSLGALAMKGKGSMHPEKEVTSQVLGGQRYQRGTSAQVPAQSIGGRCYSADTLSNKQKMHLEK